MTIVVAESVLLDTADTYVSIADSDAYHGKMQNDDWFLIDTSTKEALLMRAAVLIDARYRSRWTTAALALTTVPASLERANSEAALFAIAQDLPKTLDRGVKEVRVGGIGVVFDDNTIAPTTGGQGSIWDFIDMLLSDIAIPPSTMLGGATGWAQIAITRA